MAALTARYAVPGHRYFCNIPNIIRVNLLSRKSSKTNEPEQKNQLHIQLYGDEVYSQLKCCPTRPDADQEVDVYANKYVSVFN